MPRSSPLALYALSGLRARLTGAGYRSSWNRGWRGSSVDFWAKCHCGLAFRANAGSGGKLWSLQLRPEP